MASWNDILQEALALNRPDAYDVVRRQKIQAVQQLTGRHLIIYATDFMSLNPLKARFTADQVLITLWDKDGFDEVTRNLPGGCELDVLLHSSGGSAEATESIIAMLRSRFSKLRFIIPRTAKSAATMMAMAGDQLLLDDTSELGPTDPQMFLLRDGERIVAPAQAIKDQFEVAQQEINSDPDKLPAWLPVLRQYGPALLAQCDNHLALAHELVSKWLEQYMFAEDQQAAIKAEQVAKYLADHHRFLSHERRIGMADLQGLGLNVLDMRTDPPLHTVIRDLYIAISLTFLNTGAYKIFENDLGEALFGQMQVTIQAPVSAPLQPSPQLSQRSSSQRTIPLQRANAISHRTVPRKKRAAKKH